MSMAKMNKIWFMVLMMGIVNSVITAKSTVQPKDQKKVAVSSVDTNKPLAEQNSLDVLITMLMDSLGQYLKDILPGFKYTGNSNLSLQFSINLAKKHYIVFKLNDDLVGSGKFSKDAVGDFVLEIPSFQEELNFNNQEFLNTFFLPAIKKININEERMPLPNISKDPMDSMVFLLSVGENLFNQPRSFPELKIDSVNDLDIPNKLVLLQSLVNNAGEFLTNRPILILSKNILENLNKNNKQLEAYKNDKLDTDMKIYRLVNGIAEELLKKPNFNKTLETITSHIVVLAIPTGVINKDQDLATIREMVKDENITKYYSEYIQKLDDKQKQEEIVKFARIKTKGEIQNLQPYFQSKGKEAKTVVINSKFMDEPTLSTVIKSNDDFLIIHSSKNLANDKPGNFIYVIPKVNNLIIKSTQFATPLLGSKTFGRVARYSQMSSLDKHSLATRVVLHTLFSALSTDTMTLLTELFNCKIRVVKREKEVTKETTENLLGLNQEKVSTFVQSKPYLIKMFQEIISKGQGAKRGPVAPANEGPSEDDAFAESETM
jgi:hypothetical protein